MDDSFLDHFPNLVPELDTQYSIFNLGDTKESQRSIRIGERVRMAGLLSAIGRAMGHARAEKKLSSEIHDAGLFAAHKYFSKTYDLQPSLVRQDIVSFIRAIKRARILLYELIEKYFPKQYQKQLELTSDVDMENDPIQLMRMCCTPGTDVLSQRKRFEARRQLTLASLLFEMQLFGNGIDDLESDMSRFDDDIKRYYFLPQKSASYKIVSELNAKNLYRLKKDGLKITVFDPAEKSLHSTGIHRVTSLDMRFIHTAGREIPVYYEVRVKSDAVWKLIRKCHRNTAMLEDLCGVKCVFLNEKDLLDGVNHLRRTIAREPGVYFGDDSNLARGGVIDTSNIHSASEYRAKKYFAIKYKRIFEFQVMLMQDWINEQFSRGSENHNLYRLRTFQNDLFPRVFPSVFYRLDWADLHLQKTLVDLQHAKIWLV